TGGRIESTGTGESERAVRVSHANTFTDCGERSNVPRKSSLDKSLVMHFREANSNDVTKIVNLYQRVADKSGGIARLAHEITQSYVSEFVRNSLERGLIIVCEHPENPGQLIAGIHAFKPGISVFDHVLSNLTLVV